ncbi:MAG TPA: pseudouridine synthase, partial [Ruminococcaceae bacterium]|nr:pseudouridine synthase [Oscillospiraceae bacterium]
MQKKEELVRIQKVLSESGVMSRRKAEEYIESGKVTVNGRKASIGQKINPARDIVAVEGVRVETRQHQKKIYLALHKPRGYVTTMNDEMDRRCVAQLVQDAPARVYPIGRLDRNSEGLLLMTNDGDFANQIMHPRYHVPKCYRVTVRPDINDEQAMRLAEGV